MSNSDEVIEDERVFGKDVWIYCNQHLRPHMTGWCTVAVRNKVALKATDAASAYTECQKRRFKLYDDLELN
jgi:hypothetical protein